MKLYADKAVAEAMVAKLSKNGKLFMLVEQDGQYGVALVKPIEVETPAPTANKGGNTEYQGVGSPPASEVLVPKKARKSKDKEVAQPVSKKIKPDNSLADQIVEISIEGAYLTPVYAIIPPIGDYSKKKSVPVDHWIEQAHLVSYEPVPGGLKLVGRRKVFTSRCIREEMLKVVEEEDTAAAA